MTRLPTQNEIESWGDAKIGGFAIVCGKVSGGLVTIDFDSARFFDVWMDRVGATDLCIQKSGRDGGGYHVRFKVKDKEYRSDKLAYFKDDTKVAGRAVAIEIKGESAYAVAAPSIHNSGRPYEVILGDLLKIPTISVERAEALIKTARDLDEAPITNQEIEKANQSPLQTSTIPRVGPFAGPDVIGTFNERYTIDTILESYGYTRVGDRYAPPNGKRGLVAILEGKYAFSHNSDDLLSDGHRHDAFSVFCKCGYGGDYKAAVAEARTQMGIAMPSGPLNWNDGKTADGIPTPIMTPSGSVIGAGSAVAPQQIDSLDITEWSKMYANGELRENGHPTYLFDGWNEYRYREGQWSMYGTEDLCKMEVGRWLDRILIKQKVWIQYLRTTRVPKSQIPKQQSTHLILVPMHDNLKRNHMAKIEIIPSNLDLQSGVYKTAPAGDLIVFRDVTINPYTKDILTNSPRVFDPAARRFDYNPNAAKPEHFLEWVRSIFDNDMDLIRSYLYMLADALQPQLHWQVIHLLHGPPRSGKGITLDIIKALAGGNACSIDAKTCSGDFGLAPAIGRSAIIFPDVDAHLDGALVSKLKSISGGDALTINVKNMPHFQGRMLARIFIASNNLLRFSDKSGAMESRARAIGFTKSFVGREDPTLRTRIMAEVPLIAPYLINMLPEIRERGFPVTECTKEYVVQQKESNNPIISFFEECVDMNAVGHSTSYQDVYQAYSVWCKNGNQIPLGKNQLKYYIPILKDRKRIDEHQRVTFDSVKIKNGIRSESPPF